jgi:prolyl-tRNA editing enzyme YbaK/EbsC (Cys-tRNA(Pro) deacylase)
MTLDEERVNKVESLLEKFSLDAKIIWHRNNPVLSLEDAIRVHGLTPGNVLKCLLLKSRKGIIIAVMASGEVRIDMKKLGHKANVKKLSFMSKDEMKKRYSIEPGGLDPFILQNITDLIFMDSSLLDKDYVMGSAGSKYCGLKIRSKDLVEAINVQVTDIARLD